jgi:hypothetical protein
MTRIAVAFAVFLVAGCHVPIGHFTVLGDPAKLVRSAPIATARTTGESCRWWILGVTLGVPSMQEAIDDALANAAASGARRRRPGELASIYAAGKHCYPVSGAAVGDALIPSDLESDECKFSGGRTPRGPHPSRNGHGSNRAQPIRTMSRLSHRSTFSSRSRRIVRPRRPRVRIVRRARATHRRRASTRQDGRRRRQRPPVSRAAASRKGRMGQRDSAPALIARQGGAKLTLPNMTPPGFPPPLVITDWNHNGVLDPGRSGGVRQNIGFGRTTTRRTWRCPASRNDGARQDPRHGGSATRSTAT